MLIKYISRVTKNVIILTLFCKVYKIQIIHDYKLILKTVDVFRAIRNARLYLLTEVHIMV